MGAIYSRVHNIEEGLQATPLVREIRAVRPTVHKKSAMSTPRKPLHSQHHGHNSKKHDDPSLVVNKWAQYKKKMSSTKSPNQHAKHASSKQSKKSTH